MSNQNRMKELRALGDDEIISPEIAASLLTSAIIMTMVKLPELVMDIQKCMIIVKDDEEEVKAFAKSLGTITESFSNCVDEIDLRFPTTAVE